MTRCDLTDLLVDECGCPQHRGEPDPPRSDVELIGQPLEARYEGRCATCEGLIALGQRIARVADRPGVYAHVYARECQ